jgi:hypothetical protein
MAAQPLNGNVRTSDLAKQKNLINSALTSPNGATNGATSIFAQLKAKMNEDVRTNSPELQQDAAAAAFLGLILGAAKNIPTANRDAFVTQAIDLNNDGRFDEKDLAILDETKNGKIDDSEISGHLNGLSADNDGDPKQYLNDNSERMRRFGMFTDNNNVDPRCIQQLDGKSAPTQAADAPVLTPKQAANKAILVNYLTTQKGLSEEDAKRIAGDTVVNPHDPGSQILIKEYNKYKKNPNAPQNTGEPQPTPVRL